MRHNKWFPPWTYYVGTDKLAQLAEGFAAKPDDLSSVSKSEERIEFSRYPPVSTYTPCDMHTMLHAHHVTCCALTLAYWIDKQIMQIIIDFFFMWMRSLTYTAQSWHYLVMGSQRQQQQQRGVRAISKEREHTTVSKWFLLAIVKQGPLRHLGFGSSQSGYSIV